MSKRWIWASAAFMALASTCTAAQSPAPEPAEPAPSASVEQPARVDELLAPLVAKFAVPALGGAIIDLERGLVAIGASGVRERGKDTPVTSDDLWHLGSCTKAMTATLAARLVVQGKITWDTSVEQAFPRLEKQLHANWRGAKLEWLLQNRGGAPGKAPEPLWIELGARDIIDPLAARRWFVEKLLEAAPANQPGAKFEYSNQGFVIAGAMLEARGGASWEELMRREIFEPLGMASAGFGAPGSAEALDQPRGHSPKPQQPGPRADNPRAIGPAGTVHASLADWGKFIGDHLRGAAGKKGLLPSALYGRLHECPDMQAYAMGWGVSSRPWAGGDVLTHSGSNTMWYAVVWIAPEKGVAFLATCNEGGDNAAKACDAVVVALAKSRGLM